MISKRVKSCVSRPAYPTRHETKTTESRTDTKSTLTTELNSHETERFIMRRDQREVGSTEQVRRKSSELGLGEDAIREKFHEASQLRRGELSVEIDDGSDSNELDRWVLLEPGNESARILRVGKGSGSRST
jgi:hypothetical protein